MAVAPARIDRARIAELTERESRTLNERTPKSRAMFERARKALAGGVASSYQLRDPWPIYLDAAKGSRVWDVDGNEMVDFHNGFGSMVQGHAHPAITTAVQERVAKGTHFAAPTEDAIARQRGAGAAVRSAAVAVRQLRLGSDDGRDPDRAAALTGRDTIVKIFGSYHGHHDA